jgi:hypothetical protein
VIRQPWTFADMLILAALFTRDDAQSFTVRRVLERVERGEIRPREAAQLLNQSCESSQRA